MWRNVIIIMLIDARFIHILAVSMRLIFSLNSDRAEWVKDRSKPETHIYINYRIKLNICLLINRIGTQKAALVDWCRIARRFTCAIRSFMIFFKTKIMTYAFHYLFIIIILNSFLEKFCLMKPRWRMPRHKSIQSTVENAFWSFYFSFCLSISFNGFSN